MKISRGFTLITFIIFIITPLFLFASQIINYDIYSNANQRTKISLSAPIEIKVESDKAQQSDGSYVVGSEISFEITDSGYSSVKITLAGSERTFDLTLELSGGKWYEKWNTQEPSSGEDPVPPDTYEITLKIDGSEKGCNPTEIKISAENSGVSTITIVIIIAIIGGVSASALLVVRKKRKSKEDKVEFGEADKTKPKKRGEIYSGASAIGKRSGQLAEEKAETESTAEPSVSVSKPPAFKPFGIDRPEKTPQQLMPADTEFKFETKTSTSVAMMKDMESKMDLESRAGFSISKTDSILQNIDFFKAILAQQEQNELVCPTCKKKMSQFWSKCPYCTIKEHDSELGLKQSLLSISESVKFCPDCKRLIKPNWITCPFCFVKQKTA